MLSIRAVFLKPDDPFTWASGIHSPIYCDNRLTLAAPAVRKDVEAGLAEIVKEKFPEAEMLMGTSTAGIAHAAITATILDLPMGYVRSGHKDHGRQNQIEGKMEPGTKVVVIEDLISTGGSVLEVVDVLAAADVVNYSLSDFDTLSKVAAAEGYIADKDIAKLTAFQKNPQDPAWMEL